MAVAVAQSRLVTGANVTTVAIAYNSALTNPSLLWAVNACYRGSATAVGVSDSSSHTWTGVAAEQNTTTDTNHRLRSFTAPNTGTATPTVTFSCSANSYYACVIAEITGHDTTTPLDGVTPTTNSGTGTTVTAGNITPATNNGMILGAMTMHQASLSDPTITPAGGFTQIQESEAYNTSMVVASNYLIQTTAGTDTAEWTLSGFVAGQWIAHNLVIKAAAGGSGATATPTVVTAAASVPAPTISVGQTVTATVVTATTSVPAPTVSTASNANVTATVVTATASAPAPTVSVGKTVTATVVTATASVPAPTAAAYNGRFPTTVDGTNKRFLDQVGDPWYGVGDTAWSLVGQLSQADITTYLTNIAAEGVNLVLFNAPEPYFTDNTPAYRNAAGADPFTGTVWQSSINDTYWQTVDHAVETALSLGITCLICPQYLGFSDVEGWRDDITTAYTADPANFTTYGTAIAARYAAYPNIMWLIGHDTNPTASTQAASILVADELASGTTHLITAGGGETTGTGIAEWSGSGFTFDFDTVYDYDDAPGQDTATARTSNTTIYLEGKYEQEQSIGVGDQLLREQVWEPFCAGAAASIFGNNPRWHFESGKELYAFSGTWQNSITNATYNDGTVHLGYFADFLAAVDCLDTLPDTTGTFLTSGTGFARFDTTIGVAYQTAASSITLDTTELAGTGNVRIRRYDPTDGSFTTVAASEAQNSARSITHPGTNAAGGNDYVYVVDLVGDSTVSATVVTVSASVPAPTASAGSSVTATVVTATASVPSATASAGSSVTATVVTATASVPAPSVTAGGAANVTATVVTALASVPAPTVSVGVTVTATVVTALASVPSSTASAGASLTATVVTATADVPVPSVSAGGSASVTATVVTATASVPAPSLSAGSTVTATVVTALVSVLSATVVAGAVAAIYGPALTAAPPPILTWTPPPILKGRSS